ncbi:MAG: class B sortase [Eubacteriales bacterium]|nr:class B sortase [Eubacteriales bacterium]
MKKAIINILLIFFLGVLLYSGYHLYGIFSEYYKGRSAYKKTSEQFVTEKKKEKKKTETEKGETSEEEEPYETAPIEVDFKNLLKQNSDVAGWIYCPDTVVNYPVMHAEDNDKYLHHLVNKEYNFAGCIFEDFRNTRRQKDPATILYGHHMNDGSMFAMLHKYTDQEYYKEHPTMWYLTPDQNYRLDLIMGYVAEEKDPVYSLFITPEEMQEYLRSVEEKSTFEPDTEYKIEDIRKIIVLSTCAYEFQNARYIVIAVPVPIH